MNQGGSGSPATAGTCVNLAGICVLDAYNSNTMFFRGMASGTPILTISLDATNHVILLNLDVNALAAALPQATTTQAGVGETATDAEAQAKVSTTVFLTPSNLAALGASTTLAGLIETSTNAEAIAGTSTTVALTPAAFTAAMAANFGTTVTFASAVARAAAVPEFVGQFAGQVDTLQPYFGTALSAGSWNPVFSLGITNVALASTTLNLDGNFLTIHSGGLVLLSSTSNNLQGGYIFDNANIVLTDVSTLDFDNAVIKSGGITVPADSVLLTSSTPGSLDSRLITDFASLVNTDSGWTGFTNSLVRKTCDCNTVTTAQLAQIVDTLINILITPRLPTP